jgi:hypothetical protein
MTAKINSSDLMILDELSRCCGFYSFARLHLQIELFLNGVWDGDWPVEMLEFFNFLTVEIIPRGWKPYRTEWSIFDEDHMIAGQIDSLWIDPSTGSLHMIDWKRCAKPLNPNDGERFNRFGRVPCDFLVDNSFGHYAVQQNLYAAILRDSYGMKLSSMWLVQLHIDLPSYIFIPVPAFLDVAAVLLMRSAPGRGSHPLDRLGGTPVPADDAEWQRRQSKRAASVAAIKRTPEYQRCQALDSLHPVTTGILSPDPFDRTVSKRSWEKEMMDWRHALRAMADVWRPALNCCLLKSLWSLGVPVPLTRDGPFFALLDGNMLLFKFHLSLQPIVAEEIVVGQYVRWHAGHFVGVQVLDTHILVHDEGEHTSHCHLEELIVDPTTVFFKLVPYPGLAVFGTHTLSDDRLGGAGEEEDSFRCLEDLLEDEQEVDSMCLELDRAHASVMEDTRGVGPSHPPSEHQSQPEGIPLAGLGSSMFSGRCDIEGGVSSHCDFQTLFRTCSTQADTSLSSATPDVEKGRSNIMDRTRELTNMVAARHRVMLREYSIIETYRN